MSSSTVVQVDLTKMVIEYVVLFWNHELFK